MPDTPPVDENLAHDLGEIRSTCFLLEWAVASYDLSPPEGETGRMEWFEGMGFVLRAIVERLGAIHGQVSP